jgi:hypothetical protein
MLSLTNATISTNSVRGGDGGAGNSVFPGGDGGAALGGGITVSSGTLGFTNCTIAANRAETSSGGPGHPPGSPGTGQAGGVRNFLTTVNALNTLFGNNAATSAPDFSGTLSSQGHNLISNRSGGSGYSATDLLDVDPGLGPLQDNGGPTVTHALLAGSPALNAGNPNQLGVPDQRGVVRTGGVNVGAYQASASTFLLIAPDAIQAGVPFNLSVTAVDPFGQVAYGYTGTVTFTCDDAAAVLPDDYQLQPSDQGSAVFAVTLNTSGPVHLTVTDTVDDTVFAALDLVVL